MNILPAHGTGTRTDDGPIQVDKEFLHMNVENYFSGGRLGDFIHQLWVVRKFVERSGKPATIYITNDPRVESFSGNFERTVAELKELLEGQSYIRELRVASEENESELEQIPFMVHLSAWRNGFGIMGQRTNWITFLSKTYELDNHLMTDDGRMRGTSAWIDWPVEEDLRARWKDTVFIHRSKMRHNPIFPWRKIIGELRGLGLEVCFISSDPKEYDAFEKKEHAGLGCGVPFQHAPTLKEMARLLRACRLFIGNMSSPLALAVAIGAPVIVEYNRADAHMYRGSGFSEGNMWGFLTNLNKDSVGIEKIIPGFEL